MKDISGAFEHMPRNEIILLPSFQERLKDPKIRSHKKVIDRLVMKLERMGKNALKTLGYEYGFLLAEMRTFRPPYRLYVIVDENNSRFWLVAWEHKKQQDAILRKIRTKLSQTSEYTLEKIFT